MTLCVHCHKSSALYSRIKTCRLCYQTRQQASRTRRCQSPEPRARPVAPKSVCVPVKVTAEAVPPAKRPVTKWLDADVLTPLMLLGKGAYSLVLRAADRWLQEQDPEQCTPVDAQMLRHGQMVLIRYRQAHVDGIQCVKFEAEEISAKREKVFDKQATHAMPAEGLTNSDLVVSVSMPAEWPNDSEKMTRP